MLKWLAVALLAALGAAGAGWWPWSNSPMREMERSRAAVEKSTNWHYHTVRLNRVDPSVPPETVDEDIFCPTFSHVTNSSLDVTDLLCVARQDRRCRFGQHGDVFSGSGM